MSFKVGDKVKFIGDLQVLRGTTGEVTSLGEGQGLVVWRPDDPSLTPAGIWSQPQGRKEWLSEEDELELVTPEFVTRGSIQRENKGLDLLTNIGSDVVGGWDYLNTPRNGRL